MILNKLGSISWNVGIFSKFREIELNLVKITMRPRRHGYSMSLKVRWGYIWTKKLDTQCALLLRVSISVKTKAIWS